MKGIAFLPGFIAGLFSLAIILPVTAQVTSDGTTNTTINQSGNNFNILNGIQKGNNLFHSFNEFSIPTGGSATFNNSTNVVNIINRVTGGDISNIDGLIKSQGNANLFLINPSGIVFGENASLDIGGSFLGSTAESILFGDGFEFSAVNPQSESLLTVSVPLGLQMGQNSGAIQVNGNGHQLTGGIFTPVNRSNTQSTLQVNSGNAIALIGGDVNLNGGVLTAENGRIELGAVTTGIVKLDSTSSTFGLNYDNVENFGDIQLINQSLVDASASTSGGIQLQGQNIILKDGSFGLIQTTINETPSEIKVSAKGTLELSEDVKIAPDTASIPIAFNSGFITEIIGRGKGIDIDIDAGSLSINNGSFISTRTFGVAMGGNIIVNVAGDIRINSGTIDNLGNQSGIFTSNFGSGQSGNVDIFASNLFLTEGGTINTSNFGQGDSGNLNVNILDTILVSSVNSNAVAVYSSSIGSTSFREGNSGNFNLNTSRLIVENGADINVSSLNSSNGGNIDINASEYIVVRGTSPDGEIPSRISAGSYIISEFFRQPLGLPNIPSGDAGSVTITTPKLQVENKGEVAVNNQGLGNGGSLTININSLLVNNQGKLIADTASDEGGNIFLNIKSDLILRNNSLINTEALGTGNGGNININSPVIAGLENSDIIANAVEGNGGNINITTSGIFGLEFSDELTPESDITASSQFGVNGTVEVNNLDLDPSSGLVELPKELVDSSQQIASGCSTNTNSSFVATGRGGIPQKPNQQVNISQNWLDVRDLSAFRKQNNNTVENPNISNQPAIVEATGFIRNQNGEIELVADSPTNLNTNQIANCSGETTS